MTAYIRQERKKDGKIWERMKKGKREVEEKRKKIEKREGGKGKGRGHVSRSRTSWKNQGMGVSGRE